MTLDRLDGLLVGDRFGYSLAALPSLEDETGYLFDEVLVGAPGARIGRSLFQLRALKDAMGVEHEGYAAVYSYVNGTDPPDRIRKAEPNLPAVYHEAFRDCLQVTTFGWSVSYAGDVNEDGQPDFLVGAPGLSHSTEQPSGVDCDLETVPVEQFGGVFVFSGTAPSGGATLSPPLTNTGLPYSLPDTLDKDWLGYSVAGLDGFVWPSDSANLIFTPSMLIGAARKASSTRLPMGVTPCTHPGTTGCPGTGGGQGGMAFVVRLNLLFPDVDVIHLRLNSEHGRDGFGMAVALGYREAGVGDLPDLIVSAPRYGPNDDPQSNPPCETSPGVPLNLDEIGKLYVFYTDDYSP